MKKVLGFAIGILCIFCFTGASIHKINKSVVFYTSDKDAQLIIDDQLENPFLQNTSQINDCKEHQNVAIVLPKGKHKIELINIAGKKLCIGTIDVKFRGLTINNSLGKMSATNKEDCPFVYIQMTP